MTPCEFKDFLAGLDAEMPSVGDHLGKHTRMMAPWQRELADISLGDAVEALRRMRRGDAERPASVLDRDCFPAFVQTAVGAIRFERLTRVQAEEDAQKRLRTGSTDLVKVGMRAAFCEVLQERKRALAGGEDPNAAGKALATKLFSELPEDRRDRVKCRVCRDLGAVECWDLRAMADARHAILQSEEPTTSAWRTCWVQCSCEAGKAQWTRQVGKSVDHAEMPRFDPLKWVLASEGHQALLEWASHWRPANYQDFGAYAGN